MGRDCRGHTGGDGWPWLCPQTLTTNILHKSLNKMANAVSLKVSLGPEVLLPHCLILSVPLGQHVCTWPWGCPLAL